MSRFILALDQGTTSSRAILFNEAGERVASAQREISQIYPQPGWVEHDPEEIWNSQVGVAHQVLSGISPSEVVAIGIANQRETTLLWDRSTGNPICNAIVWQDRRTAGRCDELKEGGYEPLIRSKTGLVIDSYFSATKLEWMLDHIPDARARAEAGELAFGTVDSFLIWRLSEGRTHVTDPSNASRTMLFDIDRMEWSNELLELFRIPKEVLPTVVPSSCEISASTLFGGLTPIAGIAGDQQAATYGQACFEPGMAKNTYGTGCFLLMNQGNERQAVLPGLLGTVGWALGPGPEEQQGNGEEQRPERAGGDLSPVLKGRNLSYAVEGSVFIAGAAIQWLRDELGLIASAEESSAIAESVADTSGAILVPAFVGLGAPHWDPYARGILIGLTRGVGKAHLVRAALESIALQTRDVVEEMQKGAGPKIHELRVDGGASRNDFLMQFQADILGIPVLRPKVAETTALGAAYLAGLAVGFWMDQHEIASQWQVELRFEPRMSAEERDSRYETWLRAVERSKGWAG